jgi:integrase
VTVEHLARRWCESYVATERNPVGQAKAAQRVRKYLVPFLGMKPLYLVKPDNLRAYRLWLEGLGLSPQTVKHVLSDARCMFGWAVDEGYLVKSPVPRKKFWPKIQERPPDRLFDDEDGLLVVSQTKSGKVRRVPIPEELAEELKLRVGRLLPMDDSRVLNQWVRKNSSVKRFHAHMLRHTFGCQWLEAGGSPAALQEILGHASIVTTQRYARLSEAHVRAEAERIGGKLGKIPGRSMGNA